jgi:hypothetical protein
MWREACEIVASVRKRVGGAISFDDEQTVMRRQIKARGFGWINRQAVEMSHLGQLVDRSGCFYGAPGRKPGAFGSDAKREPNYRAKRPIHR